MFQRADSRTVLCSAVFGSEEEPEGEEVALFTCSRVGRESYS